MLRTDATKDPCNWYLMLGMLFRSLPGASPEEVPYVVRWEIVPTCLGCTCTREEFHLNHVDTVKLKEKKMYVSDLKWSHVLLSKNTQKSCSKHGEWLHVSEKSNWKCSFWFCIKYTTNLITKYCISLASWCHSLQKNQRNCNATQLTHATLTKTEN